MLRRNTKQCFSLILTCENLLPQIREQLQVDDGGDDALEGAELRVYPQGEQHEEEQDRPEGRRRELVDGLGEHDERQTSAGARLFSGTERRQRCN